MHICGRNLKMAEPIGNREHSIRSTLSFDSLWSLCCEVSLFSPRFADRARSVLKNLQNARPPPFEPLAETFKDRGNLLRSLQLWRRQLFSCVALCTCRRAAIHNERIRVRNSATSRLPDLKNVASAGMSFYESADITDKRHSPFIHCISNLRNLRYQLRRNAREGSSLSVKKILIFGYLCMKILISGHSSVICNTCGYWRLRVDSLRSHKKYILKQ